MKKKKTLLLAAAIISLGAVAATSAFLITEGDKNVTDTVDGALILKWGTNSLADVTDLTPQNPAYRTVVVKKPTASTSVTDTVRVKFALTGTNFAGITVEGALADWAVSGTTATVTLTDDNTPQYHDVAMASFTNDITFFLKISIGQTEYDALVAADGQLAASLTMTLGLASSLT